MVILFKDQDYALLKSQHNKHKLFEDKEFSADDSSIYAKERPPFEWTWKRPKEIRPNAQFVVASSSYQDLDQGNLGNCWFVAAVSGLSLFKSLLDHVVLPEQTFDRSYAGICRFRFWRHGAWTEVVVDDRLPCDSEGKLIYCSNRQEPDEFWPALLEKAYAKIHGSYEALSGGIVSEAAVDLTGGLEELYLLKQVSDQPVPNKEDLWKILKQAMSFKSIIGCSILADPNIKEAHLSNGLVRGHAFTITKAIEAKMLSDVMQRLVRVRNPWGREVEWNGDWSDTSPKWNELDIRVKTEHGIVKEKDGEFWMSYDDWFGNFDRVSFAHISPEALSGDTLKPTDNPALIWHCSQYYGEWSKNSAGGPVKSGTYFRNPMYLINLVETDFLDKDDKATVIVSLMQKYPRGALGEARRYLTIGFRIFAIKGGFDPQRFRSDQLVKVGSSGNYKPRREICRRFRLPPGNYIAIPTTDTADEQGQFLLRIFTEVPDAAKESGPAIRMVNKVTEKKNSTSPVGGCCSFCCHGRNVDRIAKV